LGSNCTPVFTPSSPEKAPTSQKFLEQRKEMTFDRRLQNITDLVFRGLYFSSSENLMKKTLHEITANNQG